ncbi:TPA: hypothetical protein DCZ46_01475 [Candidatus Campbellbacteria bacterium]|nr:hypothetical protein [Candidatus Campbellbacteria bacterium]
MRVPEVRYRKINKHLTNGGNVADKSFYVELADLVGAELSNFKVLQMTEVYQTNEDGRKVTSLGFFKDEDIAKAFSKVQINANYHQTSPAFVLTNGLVGYVINNSVEPIKLFDDEEEMVKIREKILSKLSPEEQHILGIKK